MDRFVVTAIFKGDHVYVSTVTEWPSMRSRIQCSATPQYMSERAASRVAAFAQRAQAEAMAWDRLTDIRVEEEAAG